MLLPQKDIIRILHWFFSFLFSENLYLFLSQWNTCFFDIEDFYQLQDVEMDKGRYHV